MDQIKKLRKRYIYGKPECKFAIRFFGVISLSYLVGGLIYRVNIKEILGSNEIFVYESSSVAINLFAGYFLTNFISLLKYSFTWLRDKVYHTKDIEYVTYSDYFPDISQNNSGNYFVHKELQSSLVREILSNIASKQNNLCLFLASTPGMGKTIFLRQVMDALELCGEQVCFIDKYDCLVSHNKDEIDIDNVRKIIIFDNADDLFMQHRDVLALSAAFTNTLNSIDIGTTVIFSFSSEYLSDILQFTQNINSKKEILFFKYDDTTLNEIEKRLCECVGIDTVYFHKKITCFCKNNKLRVIKNLMLDLRRGRLITLTEISIITKLLVRESEDTIKKWNAIIRRNSYDVREYFVDRYLTVIIKKAEVLTITLVILYSCAKTTLMRRELKYHEIQDLCYVDNDTLMNIIMKLENAGIFKRNPQGYVKERRIELQSNYWIDKIYNISKMYLDASIIYNLDGYFAMKDSKIYSTTSTYEDFLAGTSILKKLLCIALPFCLLLNIRNYAYCNSEIQYYFFLVLNILGGLTVIYNYNYVYHFLLPCNPKFWLNSLVSLLCLMGVLWFYDYWFLFWGLGMLVQVISLVILGPHIFTKDIIVFTMIGSLVSGLGYGLNWFCANVISSSNLPYIPLIKIISMIIVIAIMFGALARHIIIMYLISNVMKVKNKL